MTSWLISVPVWGDSYFATFVRAAAPALTAAANTLLDRAGVDLPRLKFVVHTDQPADVVRELLQPYEVDVRLVERKPTYVTLQESHADAVASAAPGDRVVLLNADIAISGNLLSRCAEHFDAGMQAVVLLGIRTAAGPEAPPAGADPRVLLEWAWEHRHQIIRDLEWPHGGSMLPTNLFFTTGENTVARGFHLHPAAIVRQEATSFRSTIDGDLLDCFPRDRIHVVVDPDDCSMCEVSPPDRRFPVRTGPLTPSRVAASMRTRASDTHRWLFTHRIVVRGQAIQIFDGTPIFPEDVPVVREILRLLAVPPPSEPAAPRRPQPRPGPAPGGRRGRIPHR